MQRYIVLRLVQGVITLFIVSLVVFILSRLTGNPLDILLPIEATKEDYAVVGKALGLDRPLPVQYVIFVGNALRGDFGKSIRAKRPVMEMIRQRLPNSAKLAAAAMAIALGLAFPLGVLAAVKKDQGIDEVAKVFAVLGMATPNFWLGIILILVFAVQFRWFPPFGMGGPEHYVLPAFTMGWSLTAGMMRLLRSSMLEVLDAEYVKLARIKGVHERWVIWRHALRNALIPLVTFAGYYFAILVGGAVVTETIFAWPGVGRLAYEAVMWRDFPLIQGVVLVVAAVVLIVNLLVDILYAYLDPRIRY